MSETKERQVCNECGYLFCGHRQPPKMKQLSEIEAMIEAVNSGKVSPVEAQAFLSSHQKAIRALEYAVERQRRIDESQNQKIALVSKLRILFEKAPAFYR